MPVIPSHTKYPQIFPNAFAPIWKYFPFPPKFLLQCSLFYFFPEAISSLTGPTQKRKKCSTLVLRNFRTPTSFTSVYLCSIIQTFKTCCFYSMSL